MDTRHVGMAKSRRWTAQWIWHPHAPPRNAYVLFRGSFELCSAANARLFITADTRYRVWLNGQLLGDGPPPSQPYHQYYDERDLSDVAVAGRNVLAVLVHHQGLQPATRGGLLAEVSDGTGTVVGATGPGWHALVGSAWRTDTECSRANQLSPFQEHVDLRVLPFDWWRTDYDDRAWEPPEVLAYRGNERPPQVMPWCRLVPRPIPYLEAHEVYASAIQSAEECLDLAPRHRPADLSASLSQAGRPLEWAKIESVENLLRPEGETLFFCSTRHRDGVTDGRYDPCVTLDFGRVITGHIEVEATASGGAALEIGYAERLIDGRFNNALECPFADRVVFAEGDQRFRPLAWRAFRYVRLRVKQAEHGLRLRAVRAIKLRYPYWSRGSFRGDRRLEQIFEICRTTLELCSIESLMDTPFREQAQWLGDVSAVTIPGIYACFGDTALPEKFLLQAAANSRPTGLLANISNVVTENWSNDIPDYSLWWVIALWRHFLYTGRPEILHACYPEMQRILRAHLERLRDDGLLDPMFGWVFFDWADVDRFGISASYNALFAGACDAAAAVARVKGDTWAETLYRNAATRVRAAFPKHFLDPTTGLVVDAVRDGMPSPKRSEHANAAAIAFGCVDEATADRIVETVFDRRTVRVTEAQPFFMVVVLAALQRRGRMDLALRLIEERWGRRMVDRGRSSCTEEWYENGSWRTGDWSGFQRTHSHAWSACPAEFLITGLAGIEILEPGCTRLRLRPYTAGSPYAVIYPTPRGEVKVRWDGKQAEVEVPPGTQRT